MREAFGEFCTIALAEARNKRLLAVEVDVEGAGADARLATDRLHRGGVEAAAGEAGECRVKNVITARAQGIGL